MVSSGSGWLTSTAEIDHGRFAPGAVVADRYRIIGLLGRGGMGEVFRADDLRLGQPVALKFLPAALERDPMRLAQFHNEVRTARQVSHSNVCRVYDISEADGQHFLTMEFVDGEDLSSLLRRIGRLPEDKALEIARQICAGLHAAHERGVLHRDLKPANIMLDKEGRARITDFSLAAAAGTVEDIRAGTPAYMAPEQLAGREVTARSDIYALGLVLYELFTGKRAIEAKTIAELVVQQESGAIAPPSSFVTSLDPVIERGIMRCLQREPADRPATALAVAAALPGGDPLAAALAAGETPSPEMVAAAGSESAALSPLRGLSWLAAVFALICAVLVLDDAFMLTSRAPFNRSPEVLLDRARTLERDLDALESATDLIGNVLLRLSNALQNGAMGVLGLVLLRMLLRRTSYAYIAGCLLFGFMAAQGQFESNMPMLDYAFGVLLCMVLLLLVLRFGLFATVVAFFAHFSTTGVAATMDPSRVNFEAGVMLLSLLAAIAVFGFYLARAGEPLFGKVLIED